MSLRGTTSSSLIRRPEEGRGPPRRQLGSGSVDPGLRRDDEPLSVGELAAILDAIGGFAARPFIAVAVSGGPDSLALALLAHAWAVERGGTAWALTVDHRLRPESAAEAETVAGWLAARGLPHRILVWAGDKPATGIQEAAREARYALLAQWCRERGCLHLLTAHHREDQAETHAIRHRAGSGPDGLAGMPAIRELPGCRLVRPLLSLPRARLAAALTVAGQPFLRDPSNRNPVFERTRLRLDLDTEAIDAAVAAARLSAAERIARERDLCSLLARAVKMHPAGFAALDPAVLAIPDTEMAERLLGRVAACIGGARYPLRRARVARLRAALSAEPDRARTLGGCRFVRWRGQILALRELAAASPPLRVEPGMQALWDRRFAAALSHTAERGFNLGCLGDAASETEGTPGGLPRLLYPTFPAFFDASGLAAVPHLGHVRPGLGVLPTLSFRPANPLTSAGFTVV